ncbi:MAG: LicD family protein [Selenomonadales bacterium]|nr:LicD family protein [Selenomonadales bacterium]
MFNENSLVADAQKIMLQILCATDKICTEHHLTYWLEGGTLLGAVRHHGFIPWDDDMDISMPRKDYEQFLKIAPQLLPKDLFLQTQQSDPQYKLPIAKIRKRGTLLIETGETGNENYCHGIFIDIIPNDYYHNKWFIKWMRWGVTVRDRKKNYPKGSIRRHLVVLYTNVLLFFPVQIALWIHNFLSRHHEWFQDEQAKYLSHGLEFGFLRETQTADILPIVRDEAVFEGVTFSVPRHKERYLEQYFDKNYMTLPPQEKRKTHAKKIVL